MLFHLQTGLDIIQCSVSFLLLTAMFPLFILLMNEFQNSYFFEQPYVTLKKKKKRRQV